MAAGNLETLEALRRRPTQFRDPLPDIVHHAPASEFELDEALRRNLRSARRGAAAGSSGMTSEHLTPTLHWLFRLGEQLIKARVPNLVIQAVRMGCDSFEESGWQDPWHSGW